MQSGECPKQCLFTVPTSDSRFKIGTAPVSVYFAASCWSRRLYIQVQGHDIKQLSLHLVAALAGCLVSAIMSETW